MSQESKLPSDSATTVEHPSRRHDPTRPLLLSPALRRQIVQHLARWLPFEGCGLVATVPGERVDRAVHFYPGTNVDISETRFTMLPREVVDAMRHMRHAGWELGAIVHSHPRSEATLSPTDLREAYYPDTRLIIVSFVKDAAVFGCWAPSSAPKTRKYCRAPLDFGDR